MGELQEIKDSNFGLHPPILGESAYSMNRFVLVLKKKNFSNKIFCINRCKTGH